MSRLCVICDEPVGASSRGITCSYSCRAKLREQRKTREWRTEREYPVELVNRVRHLYLTEGMTVAEVQAAIGPGVKAQRIVQRFISERRPAAKRDQRGERNDMWRGDAASYGAVHNRLNSVRGRAAAHPCVDCGGPAAEWAYEGGGPNEKADPDRGCLYTTDLSYYSPRCQPCHVAQDRDRDEAGRLIRKEVFPNAS